MGSFNIIIVSIFMPPFQHNFLDLFEGLGLDISEPKAEDKLEDSPDFSYDIEVLLSVSYTS
jgi:hypothetical protein